MALIYEACVCVCVVNGAQCAKWRHCRGERTRGRSVCQNGANRGTLLYMQKANEPRRPRDIFATAFAIFGRIRSVRRMAFASDRAIERRRPLYTALCTRRHTGRLSPVRIR